VSDLTDLAAAIHEALTPPVPPHDDTAGWRLYDRLIVNRTCHVRGVLGALAGGDDSKPTMAATIRVIAKTDELIPVNYRVRDEQPGSGS
jgi:hypothetical protein